MALLTFHTIPHVKKFQSTLLSKASFFTCFCQLVCILCPFFIVYNSHGLWIKYQVHQEQPNVHFKHQALLLVRSKESSFTWSTFNEYNSLIGQYLNFPSILTLEKDENSDGTMDGLEVEFEFEVNQTIHFFQLALMFSYQLQEIASIKMEALAILQYDSGLPFSEIRFVGDLKWVQRRLIKFNQHDHRYNKTELSEFDIPDILRIYTDRDYGTEMSREHYTPLLKSTGGLFKLKGFIRYTEAKIEYVPGLWNVLKWGWMQYASILVIFIYFIEKLKNLVFGQRMIPTWNTKPENKTKSGCN